MTRHQGSKNGFFAAAFRLMYSTVFGTTYSPSTPRRTLRSRGITGLEGSPLFPSQIVGTGTPLSLNRGHAV
jgi:hypothetical protein